MTTPTPSVAELGHVGLRCHDVSRQLAFYSDVLGLTVTDHDERLGIWFLSARPDTEHHELLLAEGRDAPLGIRLIQQVSFRCARFEDVLGFHRRFREHDVRLDMIVSHGNAVGVYFYDPEGNRCEVYWRTGLVARQPFVEHIDIETDPEELLDAIRASVERTRSLGACVPVSDRPVQLGLTLPRPPTRRPPAADRQPLAAPDAGTAGPPCPGPSTLRHLHPARHRVCPARRTT